MGECYKFLQAFKMETFDRAAVLSLIYSSSEGGESEFLNVRIKAFEIVLIGDLFTPFTVVFSC